MIRWLIGALICGVLAAAWLFLQEYSGGESSIQPELRKNSLEAPEGGAGTVSVTKKEERK